MSVCHVRKCVYPTEASSRNRKVLFRSWNSSLNTDNSAKRLSPAKQANYSPADATSDWRAVPQAMARQRPCQANTNAATTQRATTKTNHAATFASATVRSTTDHRMQAENPHLTMHGQAAGISYARAATSRVKPGVQSNTRIATQQRSQRYRKNQALKKIMTTKQQSSSESAKSSLRASQVLSKDMVEQTTQKSSRSKNPSTSKRSSRLDVQTGELSTRQVLGARTSSSQDKRHSKREDVLMPHDRQEDANGNASLDNVPSLPAHTSLTTSSTRHNETKNCSPASQHETHSLSDRTCNVLPTLLIDMKPVDQEATNRAAWKGVQETKYTATTTSAQTPCLLQQSTPLIVSHGSNEGLATPTSTSTVISTSLSISTATITSPCPTSDLNCGGISECAETRFSDIPRDRPCTAPSLAHREWAHHLRTTERPTIVPRWCPIVGHPLNRDSYQNVPSISPESDCASHEPSASLLHCCSSEHKLNSADIALDVTTLPPPDCQQTRSDVCDTNSDAAQHAAIAPSAFYCRISRLLQVGLHLAASSSSVLSVDSVYNLPTLTWFRFVESETPYSATELNTLWTMHHEAFRAACCIIRSDLEELCASIDAIACFGCALDVHPEICSIYSPPSWNGLPGPSPLPQHQHSTANVTDDHDMRRDTTCFPMLWTVERSHVDYVKLTTLWMRIQMRFWRKLDALIYELASLRQGLCSALDSFSLPLSEQSLASAQQSTMAYMVWHQTLASLNMAIVVADTTLVRAQAAFPNVSEILKSRRWFFTHQYWGDMPTHPSAEWDFRASVPTPTNSMSGWGKLSQFATFQLQRLLYTINFNAATVVSFHNRPAPVAKQQHTRLSPLGGSSSTQHILTLSHLNRPNSFDAYENACWLSTDRHYLALTVQCAAAFYACAEQNERMRKLSPIPQVLLESIPLSI